MAPVLGSKKKSGILYMKFNKFNPFHPFYHEHYTIMRDVNQGKMYTRMSTFQNLSSRLFIPVETLAYSDESRKFRLHM